MLGVLTACSVIAAVVLAGLAFSVWRRHEQPAGLSLAVLLLCAAWWAGCYALELSSSALVTRGHWGDLKYLGTGLLPPVWLVFVLHYTGRRRLVSRRLLGVLAVEPLAVWLLLAVPATHDLLRFYPPGSELDEIPVVATGELFWVHLAWADTLVMLGLGIFVVGVIRAGREYRLAAAALVSAAVLPWLTNLLHNFEVGPFARVDLTPFVFVLTGTVLVWGLYRERLVNLSSIAWRLVVATMPEAVILRDASGRIRDVNPAGTKTLGRSRDDLVGTDLVDLLGDAASQTHEPPGHADRFDHAYAPHVDAHADAPDSRHEASLTRDGRVRYFEVTHMPLPGVAGARSGDLVTLRDVTARRESETRLRALLEERTRVAATLQSSLLPAALPKIPGLVLAARYEPAGYQHDVGGDFYDAFPVDADRWGLVLGDVSGKGAEAAATTSLIRYTLRTLALGEDRPSRVLGRLNDALLREGDGERFCTAIYAIASATESGMELRLCLAGHHPGLLRRADGVVEQVGVLGTALGLFAGPTLTDVTVHLGPGDLLCLFTDGLSEARDGPDLFGEERIAGLLAQTPRVSPDVILDRLATAARSFARGPLSDDLALLAIEASGTRATADAPATADTGAMQAAYEGGHALRHSSARRSGVPTGR